jgi:hypothetical protein
LETIPFDVWAEAGTRAGTEGTETAGAADEIEAGADGPRNDAEPLVLEASASAGAGAGAGTTVDDSAGICC